MWGSIRWLYLPGKPRIRGDYLGHGTCVASKVAGSTFGVAKSANIVVVRVDRVNGMVLPSTAIAAWGAVARDITLNGMQGRAVVCSTLGCEQSKP
jgi:subtilisin family serine protease